jgi:site-specific recombinase XerC
MVSAILAELHALLLEMQTSGTILPKSIAGNAISYTLMHWQKLVTGQIMPVNPAASVRGPRHVVRSGKTPVLEPEEARRLLDSIDESTSAGRRDRALISLMVYSFARIGAALGMKVEGVHTESAALP